MSIPSGSENSYQYCLYIMISNIEELQDKVKEAENRIKQMEERIHLLEGQNE